jgi:uncharacterized protein YndB with AHSA1/START domain
MSATGKTVVIIETTVDAPVEKVWEFWTEPEHIKQWNSASDDWHTPRAENDLRVGGKFLSRMEARDGSFGFDFEGIYDEVEPLSVIAYSLGDGRQVRTVFESEGSRTKITTNFDAETQNPIEMQKDGWQAILDNFKKHTEA